MSQTLTCAAFISNASRGTFAGSRGFTVTTTGDAVDYEAIIIGTSEATWTLAAGIGNAGFMLIKNTDATNYVQVGFATGVYVLRIKAGQSALLPLEPATAAIFLKADTAACVVEILVSEA